MLQSQLVWNSYLNCLSIEEEKNANKYTDGGSNEQINNVSFKKIYLRTQ